MSKCKHGLTNMRFSPVTLPIFVLLLSSVFLLTNKWLENVSSENRHYALSVEFVANDLS